MSMQLKCLRRPRLHHRDRRLPINTHSAVRLQACFRREHNSRPSDMRDTRLPFVTRRPCHASAALAVFPHDQPPTELPRKNGRKIIHDDVHTRQFPRRTVLNKTTEYVSAHTPSNCKILQLTKSEQQQDTPAQPKRTKKTGRYRTVPRKKSEDIPQEKNQPSVNVLLQQVASLLKKNEHRGRREVPSARPET